MNETGRIGDLEGRLRTALNDHAVTTFPEQQPPAMRPPRRPSGRSRWLAPALAAAAVAAIALTATSLVQDSRDSGPPAADQSTQPVLPSPLAGYPEANQVRGVRVVPLTTSQAETRQSEFTVNEFIPLGPDAVPLSPKSDRMIAGRDYSFTDQFAYSIPGQKDADPLVLRASATNATLRCPPPFLVRSGSAYDITCTLTPHHGKGVISIEVTDSAGRSPTGFTLPFVAG